MKRILLVTVMAAVVCAAIPGASSAAPPVLLGVSFDQGTIARIGESFPAGFQKQMVAYRLPNGPTIAWVHERAGDQFGNPAPGTWADPKFLRHGGVDYRFSPRLEQEFLVSLDALFAWLCAT